MMLDTKSTFDGLVTRYATSPEQTQRILENSFYRNISSALSGTQEYMAMEKLHELHEEGGFDLIVVDTPPSRHALDFLDAPQRLLRLLDNRIFRMLMVPTRTGMRIAGAAVQAFLRTISRVVGSEVVNDIVAFFRAFEGMEEGFRERAQEGRAAPRRARDALRAHHVAAARRGRGGALLRGEDRRPQPRGRRADREPGAPAVRHRALVRPARPGRFAARAAGRAARRPRRPATGSRRSTTTSPTSTRSPSGSAATSRRCGSGWAPRPSRSSRTSPTTCYDFEALAGVGRLLFARAGDLEPLGPAADE